MTTRFTHQIRLSESPAEAEAGGRTVTERKFGNSFVPAAYRWFAEFARSEGFTRKIKDTSIAGHHYANDRGDTLILR